MKSHYSYIPVDKKKDIYQLMAEEAEALNQKKLLPDVEPTDSEDDVEPETRLPSHIPPLPCNGTFSQNGWHLPEASSEKGKEKEKQSSKKQEQERMKKFVKAINALDGAEKLAEKFNGKTEELLFSVHDLIKDAKKTLKSDEFEDLYREYQFLKEKKNIKDNLKNMRRCVEALSELSKVYEAIQTIESLEAEIDEYDKQLEEIYKQFPETYKIYQLIQELPDESR